MASDKERIEVARKLRSVDVNDILFDSELVDAIEHACGSKRKRRDFGKIVDCLADLIESSDGNAELCAHCDYHDYCDLPKCSEQDGYSFKPKGYVDLLVLADTIRETARTDMEVCGDTVPAWYAAGRLENIARRIREILEVES